MFSLKNVAFMNEARTGPIFVGWSHKPVLNIWLKTELKVSLKAEIKSNLSQLNFGLWLKLNRKKGQHN